MWPLDLTRRRVLQLAAVGAGAGFFGLPAAAASHGFVPRSDDRHVFTTCNQCFLGCGLLATVRDGRVATLRGNPDAPTNRGRICPKAHAGIAKLYHPERLGQPLLRAGKRGEGRFVEATWDEALALVTEKVQDGIGRHGARSVAWWQNSDNERTVLFERFLYALGSPNFFQHPGAFSVPLAAGLALGPVYLVPDYAHAETIVVAGGNPLATKGLCWSARELLGARNRGATLIVIDPRLSETGMHASPGLWLPVKPGTDGVLLAGFCRWILDQGAEDAEYLRRHVFGLDDFRAFLAPFTVERVCAVTGIDPERFLRAARAMVGKRTVVDAFSGLSFQRDGTGAGQMRIALAALLGGIDTPGGLLPLSVPRAKYAEVEPAVPAPSGERIDDGNRDRIPLPFGPLPRHLAFSSIGQDLPKAILTGEPYPLRTLFVCNSNPVYSVPRAFGMAEALQELDLLVCLDAFMSETTMYADVVLPAATYLESTELNDLFPPYQGVVVRQPVVPPRMASRPVQDVVIDLAHRLGLHEQFPFDTYEDFLRRQLDGTPLDLDVLYARGFQDLGYETGSKLAKGLDTPSGKIELTSSVLAYCGLPPLPTFHRWEAPDPPADFPLHLITYRLPFHANSRTASNPYLSAIQRENRLLINPATAAQVGVVTGGSVRMTSSAGEVVVPVQLTEGIRPDTVALPHHFGHSAYAKLCRGRGAWFNGLVPAQTDPISFNILYETFVKVVPA